MRTGWNADPTDEKQLAALLRFKKRSHFVNEMMEDRGRWAMCHTQFIAGGRKAACSGHFAESWTNIICEDDE